MNTTLLLSAVFAVPLFNSRLVLATDGFLAFAKNAKKQHNPGLIGKIAEQTGIFLTD